MKQHELTPLPCGEPASCHAKIVFHKSQSIGTLWIYVLLPLFSQSKVTGNSCFNICVISIFPTKPNQSLHQKWCKDSYNWANPGSLLHTSHVLPVLVDHLVDEHSRQCHSRCITADNGGWELMMTKERASLEFIIHSGYTRHLTWVIGVDLVQDS